MLSRLKRIADTKQTGFKAFKAKKQWFFASAVALSIMGMGAMNTNLHSVKAASIHENAKVTQLKSEKADHTGDNVNASSKNIVKAKQGKQNKDPKGVLGPVVYMDGKLTITGTAAKGLTRNSDGTYSGLLHLHYSGTSTLFGDALWLQSGLTIGIPEELQRVFRTPGADRYVTGSSELYLNNANYDSWDYTDADKTISSDGSRLMLKTPSGLIPGGLKSISSDIYIDLGKMVTEAGIDSIDKSEYNYLFHSIFTDEPSAVIDWNAYTDTDGQASLQTDDLLPEAPVIQAPTVNQPVYASDTKITGTAEPNAKILISSNGNQIATGVADGSGNFSVTIPAQSAGTVLEVVQVTDQGQSEATSVTVQASTNIPKPTMNTPKAGDRTITGTGEIGAKVQIYDSKNRVIATATVNSNGTYSAPVGDAYELYSGETIYATQTIDGHESEKVSLVVQ